MFILSFSSSSWTFWACFLTPLSTPFFLFEEELVTSFLFRNKYKSINYSCIIQNHNTGSFHVWHSGNNKLHIYNELHCEILATKWPCICFWIVNRCTLYLNPNLIPTSLVFLSLFLPLWGYSSVWNIFKQKKTPKKPWQSDQKKCN